MTTTREQEIAKQIARAEKEAAKAAKTVAILRALPDLSGIGTPTVVHQSRDVWLSYSNGDVTGFDDVLRIFDAFEHVPGHVVKEYGWAAKMSRTEPGDDDKEETQVPDVYAWVNFDASVDNGTQFSFRKYATLADGTPLQLNISGTSAYFNKTLKHADLAARFSTTSHETYRHTGKCYEYDLPPFLAQCAVTFGARSHRNDGGALIRWGVFMTRQCLADALATLAGQ